MRTSSCRLTVEVGAMLIILNHAAAVHLDRGCLRSRYLRNRTEPALWAEYCGMNRACESAQSRNQRGRGRIQKFVRDAIHLRIAHRGGVRPASLSGDLREGHAVAGAAPSGDDDFRILSGDLLCGTLRAGLAQEIASSRINQF